MPAKSAKQYRFMQMIAHGKTPDKNINNSNKMKSVGPSQAVAKEFIDKTPAKKRSLFMSNKSK